VLCPSRATGHRVYLQHAALFSFIYSLMALGDTVVIFVTVYGHCNRLHVSVTSFFVSPFLELCNIISSNSFSELHVVEL
jgi:hypothetical protein